LLRCQNVLIVTVYVAVSGPDMLPLLPLVAVSFTSLPGLLRSELMTTLRDHFHPGTFRRW